MLGFDSLENVEDEDFKFDLDEKTEINFKETTVIKHIINEKAMTKDMRDFQNRAIEY